MLKNENKKDEMICVLEKLMEYVPFVTTVDGVVDPDTEEKVTLTSHKFHRVLCGGDQLTIERVRGCKRTKSNSITDRERLQGLELTCSRRLAFKGCTIESKQASKYKIIFRFFVNKHYKHYASVLCIFTTI